MLQRAKLCIYCVLNNTNRVTDLGVLVGSGSGCFSQICLRLDPDPHKSIGFILILVLALEFFLDIECFKNLENFELICTKN